MEELTTLLNNVHDSYPDFIRAILHYAEKKQSRQDALLLYMKSNPQAGSSDIIRFVSDQSDFTEDAAYMKVI